jgi:membrane protein implicated in regulation of membrane protease activity
MTIVPLKRTIAMSSTLPHAADEPDAVRPPQFGLRTMLIGVTALSVLFALFTPLGALRWAALMLFVSLILLHVVGNALGTRLRDRRLRESDDDNANDRPEASLAPVIAPARRLQENTVVRRPWLIAAAVCATIFGVVGGIGIATVVGEKLTPAGLVLGVGSSAVIGGFFGFMACSLWSVARTALREALETTDDGSPIANDLSQDQTVRRG